MIPGEGRRLCSPERTAFRLQPRFITVPVLLMLRFEIRQHGKKPYQFESVKSTVFVGRDQSMDLVLDDPRVSRQHAVITSKDGNYFIQDVGGRNPVRVNRKVVVRHLLRKGDAVLLGNTHLKFQEAGDGSAGTDLSGAGVNGTKRLYVHSTRHLDPRQCFCACKSNVL